MKAPINTLPITSEIAPDNVDAISETVREAADSGQAVYPLGGQTALDFGRVPKVEGIGLSLAQLARIIEYDPRDLTVTAEAGVTFSQLGEALSVEGQELPIDVPRAAEATLGGAVATNWNGPRRYGRGTLRDYLIGISAVDGRGVAFKSGGRVMKNVAGYDFAKLLTGSLGTLATVTQLTFKVRPKAANSSVITCSLRDWDQAEAIVAAMNESGAMPSAMELLAGTAKQLLLPGTASVGARDSGSADSMGSLGENRAVAAMAVLLEGNAAEVATMQETLIAEWNRHGASTVQVLPDDLGKGFYEKLVEYPDSGLSEKEGASPLAIKLAVRPSQVAAMCRSVLEMDPTASIVSHAGSGIILVRFATITAGDVSNVLIGQLRPAAASLGGSLIVLRTEWDGLTPQIIWGGRTKAHGWLERAKRQFDPIGIMNPGRLFFG